MRRTGWTKFGYYPTPERVTEYVSNHITRHVFWRRAETEYEEARTEMRIMDPCCGDGTAVARFAERLEERVNRTIKPKDPLRVMTYGIEVEEERAKTARQSMNQVWHADIDDMRIMPSSYDYLWLNPPYDWDGSGDETTKRLESRFLHQTTWGLKPQGMLIYIVPQHVLRWDADFLARHYQTIVVRRFPAPEFQDYGQVVVTAVKRDAPRAGGDAMTATQLTSMAKPRAYIEPLDGGEKLLISKQTTYGNQGWPARRMWFRPDDVATSLRNEGAWQTKEVRDLLNAGHDRARMRPIERLQEGHAAMVAANSMMDNVIITDPANEKEPIILRGFFRKVSKETDRSQERVTRTDYFESNIRAMNAVTGAVQEMGSDPEGLSRFMETYGQAIREHIDVAYPPAVDPESEECRAVRDRIATLKRPLIGKQVEATAIGATYLKKHTHLNLYFEPGTGKTCCSFAVAFGMNASKVCVMTPSRVIRNWISEIQAVWPAAIIRVIDNRDPIGTRRPPTELEMALEPAQVGRCSLEDTRRLEAWASPDRPLWVLMKKDTARRTHPVEQGLRWVSGNGAEAPAQRPLTRLTEVERRARKQKGQTRRTKAKRAPSRLIRNENGELTAWPAQSAPVGTCPECWYPLTEDERWRSNDRDAVCINEAPLRQYRADEQMLERMTAEEDKNQTVRGKYGGTWHSISPADEQESVESIRERSRQSALQMRWRNHGMGMPAQGTETPEWAELEIQTCRAPIGTAVRDESGRALYSYGDYAAEYMGRWFDVMIIDEVQDYKARETAQGETTRRMAQHAKKTMALTGTPFGGKVSEVFFLLSALNPGFGQHFGFRELGAFRKLYGREETTYNIKEDDQNRSVGVHSRRRETKKNTREIPGYHPALLEFFWHNTLFMSLQDVDMDGKLPSLKQRAHLIKLDDTAQPKTTEQLSHRDAYAALDSAMTEYIKEQLSRGSSRTLGLYLQELLTYPENAWQGTAPRDPDTNEVIIELDPLEADRLYPKEAALLELVREQVRRGRKCLVYCTHTGKRDTTTRLLKLLKRNSIKALQLKAGTVDSEERSEWLQREARSHDVIVCQPKLVETGVNLLDYPTIIWYEIEYSMFMTEQASRRSYRLNQTKDVEVYYLAYADTMQERALRIIARKADVSRTFHGDLAKTGLSTFNPDPDDIREQLAREIAGALPATADEDELDINAMLSEMDMGSAYGDGESEPIPNVETIRTGRFNDGAASQLAMVLD